MEATCDIKVSIPSFVEKMTNKKVTFYNVAVNLRGNEWTMEKRFSAFDFLNKELKKKYPNLPKMPSKTLLALKSTEGLQKRKDELEEYIQALAIRSDIIKESAFRDFLEVEQHSQDLVLNTPVKLCESPPLPLGVRDFLYLEEDGIMIIALSDMDVTSRIDAYLTNVSFPWEKQTESHVTVGALYLFRVKEAEDGAWTFDRLWSKSFAIQTNVLYWDADLNMLGIGMDDGKIYCYKISTDLNYMQYDEYCCIKAHTARVMGIAIDNKKGYMFSCGEDKKFKISDINYQEVISDIPVGSVGLKFLECDKTNSRVFLANGQGFVYIYNVSSLPPTLLVSAQNSTKSCIRGVTIDYSRDYIFTCASDGSVSVFEMDKVGKERFTKQVANMVGKPKCRVVNWSPSEREVLVGDQGGNITVWSTKNAQPIFVLDAHARAITKMVWREKDRILITGSKDKKIKVWKFPAYWGNIGSPTSGDFTFKSTSPKAYETPAMTSSSPKKEEAKKAPKVVRKGSDSDDLAGWDK